MNGMTVKSDLLLNSTMEHRFAISGSVSIVNAAIGGRVSFRGAQMDNAGNECLVMDGTQVGGDVLFDDHEGWRFEAHGALCLRGVSVKNSLDFTGATLVGSPDALLLIGSQIDANVILKRSRTKGAVGLTRATIGGEVRMQGANLSGATRPDGRNELFALYMNEIVVRGSVFLCAEGTERFEAKGLVDLYSARLDRNLVLNGANVGLHLDITELDVVYDRTVRAPRPHNAEHITKGMSVDLRQARIHGKALLGAADEHTFEARGLVCLNGAKIGSELFLRGARLFNNRRYTLSLNSAEIARDVFFDSSSSFRFESRGSVSGWGCTIGGGLRCRGALFRQREPDQRSDGDEEFLPVERFDRATIRDKDILDEERSEQAIPDEFLPAMRFDQATIRGEVFLLHSEKDPFVAKGSVQFEHARIEGDLKCDGACLFGRSKIALSLNDAVVTGGVLLKSIEQHRFEGRGVVSLDKAQIGGNLDLTGARLWNLNRQEPVALRAVDASIGGDVELSSTTTWRFEAKGQLLFSRATINGRLRCRGSKLEGEQRRQGYRREERHPVFSLYGGVVHDKVVMETGEGHRFEAFGLVDFSHTKIGAGVNCIATRFENRQGTALSLESAEVEGDVYLTDDRRDDQPLQPDERFEALGDVDLQAANINGDLSCDGRFFSERYGLEYDERGKALIFDNGRVRHRWYVRLAAESRGEVSLQGCHVGALDDDGGRNWGPEPELVGSGDKQRLLGVRLKLDGFTYDRFGPWNVVNKVGFWKWWKRQLTELLGLGSDRNIWVARSKWLRRQYPGTRPERDDFFPQPHDQTAKALYAMGHGYDARCILNDKFGHESRCRAAEPVSLVFMWFYRKLFGCGYLPNRALLTVIGWFLVGWYGVGLALDRNDAQRAVLVKASSGVEVVRSLIEPERAPKSSPTDESRDRFSDGRWIMVPHEKIEIRDIPCADISPALYALDTMLPFVDLHMEEKCEVSDNAPTWRFVKASYAMIGWILVAMAALTFTGALRREPK
jgi:hypothetical protein